MFSSQGDRRKKEDWTAWQWHRAVVHPTKVIRLWCKDVWRIRERYFHLGRHSVAGRCCPLGLTWIQSQSISAAGVECTLHAFFYLDMPFLMLHLYIAQSYFISESKLSLRYFSKWSQFSYARKIFVYIFSFIYLYINDCLVKQLIRISLVTLMFLVMFLVQCLSQEWGIFQNCSYQFFFYSSQKKNTVICGGDSACHSPWWRSAHREPTTWYRSNKPQHTGGGGGYRMRHPACLPFPGLGLALPLARQTANAISRIIVRCRYHSSDVFPRLIRRLSYFLSWSACSFFFLLLCWRLSALVYRWYW